MLFQNLIKSDEKRMAKKILMDQIEQQRNICWYSELKGQMEKYEIFDGIEQIKCYKKSKWKKLVKDKKSNMLTRNTNAKANQRRS